MSNDKIKGPVQEDPTNKYRIVDANGVYVITSNYPDRRAEIIHKLNDYGVAVKALRDIMNDLDPDVSDVYHIARETLDKLGELNEQEDK